MIENYRTLVYVAAATLAGLAAWIGLPRQAELKTVDWINQPLFGDFEDASKAAVLEVSTYSKTLGGKESKLLGGIDIFRVAQQGGRWVITSHEDYPADAERQIRTAAEALLDIRPIDVASEIPEDHKTFGVVAPPTEILADVEGVGSLVVLQDASNHDLVRLIVGNQVEGQPDHRFVRLPDSEKVFVAKLDMSKIPTDFSKWIERDLLKFNPLDVSRVMLKDYSYDVVNERTSAKGGAQLVKTPKMEALLTTATDGWNLERFQIADGAGATDQGLKDDEELNTQKLDEMKKALQDLKIEDVKRKPAGVINFKPGRITAAAQKDLSETVLKIGFLPNSLPDGQLEWLGGNGEVIFDLKDGVRYYVRFGAHQGVQKEPTDDAKAGAKKEKPDAPKLNRYVMITAALSPETLRAPLLDSEPIGPAAPENPAAPEKAAEPAAKKSGGGCDGEEKAGAQPAPLKDGPQAAETKGDDTKGDSSKEKPAAKLAPPKPNPVEAERDRIRKENKRKLDEYNDKRAKAEHKIKGLNERFGDWYYVISDDTYKKIHLSRTDIIKESPDAIDRGFGVDSFRKLEKDGVKKTSPPPGKTSRGPGGDMPGGGFPGGFPGGGFPGGGQPPSDP